ncbi:MAG: HEAT repeat domain-containing protein, partial [Acidimicrobiia bacterium]
LGALGDQRALPTLLETVANGKPQVRRRSVVALSAFDGPEVEKALAMARLDRNPMVREVAEMLLGRVGPE